VHHRPEDNWIGLRCDDGAAFARMAEIKENREMQNSVLQLDPRDNVLVALTALRRGEQIPFSGTSYELLSDIPAKQKFVTRDLGAGDQRLVIEQQANRMKEFVAIQLPALIP